MKQISVVADDRPGLLAEIANMLGERGINIESLDAEGLEGHGVVVFTVDKYDEALRVLRDNGLHAITEDAVLVRVKDEPGALGKMALRFKEANLNLHSARIVRREGGYVIMALAADDNAKCRELVKDVVAG